MPVPAMEGSARRQIDESCPDVGSAAYVQRNLRPKVTSLTVHPSGTVFETLPNRDPDIAGSTTRRPIAAF